MTTHKNGKLGQAGSSHGLAIGVGIAALAATAAGAYYLYGAEGAKARRMKLKSWTLRMKAEVMEEIEKLKEVNKEAYEAAIGTIADKYRQLKNVDPQEVSALAAKMKTHWKNIQNDIKEATGKKSVSKGVRKLKSAKKSA